MRALYITECARDQIFLTCKCFGFFSFFSFVSVGLWKQVSFWVYSTQRIHMHSKRMRGTKKQSKLTGHWTYTTFFSVVVRSWVKCNDLTAVTFAPSHDTTCSDMLNSMRVSVFVCLFVCALRAQRMSGKSDVWYVRMTTSLRSSTVGRYHLSMDDFFI